MTEIKEMIASVAASARDAGAADMLTMTETFMCWAYENKTEVLRITDEHTNCKDPGEVVGIILHLGLEQLRAEVEQIEKKKAEEAEQ